MKAFLSQNGFAALLFSVLILHACTNSSAPKPGSALQATAMPALSALSEAALSNYWYQGKAELSTYDVTQERYGELRQAEQVNVFVTEDFSAKKQVKLDDPATAGADRVPVLKLNAIRRYKTGIYDYSMMLSVFTPVDTAQGLSLKTSCTIQDWCGHVFTQLNAVQEGYQIRTFSYFETEGDDVFQVKPGLLEDEIWTLLRLSPERFKNLEISVLPSSFYCRLRHQPFKAQKARITLEKGGEESVLHLKYSDISRQLDIRFESSAPHRILGWEEMDGGKLSSKGTLKKIILSDYWARHDNASAPLRDSLSLGF